MRRHLRNAIAAAMLAAATSGGGPPASVDITLDPVRFGTRPRDFEDGTAGSTMRGFHMLVGDDAYIYTTHAADTPAGEVQTGYDPGDFPAIWPALIGRTGYELQYAAGLVTAEDHATAMALLLATIPGVTSATAAVSANSDGSWDLNAVTALTLATGTTTWAARGGGGIHGGHGYRVPEVGEATGWSDITITRPIANRINPVASDDIMWAVQVLFGDTVSTTAANRPRIQLWASTSTITPDGTELLFDFDQVPVSEMVAGAAGTIYLTPAQCLALRTAVTGATGTNFWLAMHSTATTTYVGLATGTSLNGEQFDANVQVENVASNDPTAAITEWDDTGESDFAFMIGCRLAFDNDPCTTGEHRAVWGSFVPYATYPSDVVLPDTLTGNFAPSADLIGARLAETRAGFPLGTARIELGTAGTQALDAPSLVGVTTVWDAGQTVGTGATTIAAPTGAGTIRVPATGMWLVFKGNGATGRGHVGPGPFTGTGNVDQPSDWIRRFDTGGNRGQNPGERDMDNGAGTGDDSTAFPSPILAGTEFGPDNHPYGNFEFFHPAITVAAA